MIERAKDKAGQSSIQRMGQSVGVGDGWMGGGQQKEKMGMKDV